MRLPAHPRATACTEILLVTDPGPDPDDIKALVVLATLHAKQRRSRVRLCGVIANGGRQAAARAQLALATLTHLHVSDVPVGVGSAGKPYTPQPHEYALEGYDQVDVSQLRPGADVMHAALERALPRSLVVVLISSLRDFADAILEDPNTVLAKVREVAVMGGLEPDADAPSGYRPDSSVNNEFDCEAAKTVYDFCFERGVPLCVISRDAIPMLPMRLAKSFAERSACPIMRYLADAQFLGLEGLWLKLCEGKLPARCTKQWYFETFCGVTSAGFEKHGYAQLGADADITSHLNGYVKPYDVVALMTVLPHTRAPFDDFAPTKLPAADGRAVQHRLLLSARHSIGTTAVLELLRNTYHDVLLATSGGSSPPPSPGARRGAPLLCAQPRPRRFRLGWSGDGLRKISAAQTQQMAGDFSSGGSSQKRRQRAGGSGAPPEGGSEGTPQSAPATSQSAKSADGRGDTFVAARTALGVRGALVARNGDGVLSGEDARFVAECAVWDVREALGRSTLLLGVLSTCLFVAGFIGQLTAFTLYRSARGATDPVLFFLQVRVFGLCIGFGFMAALLALQPVHAHRHALLALAVTTVAYTAYVAYTNVFQLLGQTRLASVPYFDSCRAADEPDWASVAHGYWYVAHLGVHVYSILAISTAAWRWGRATSSDETGRSRGSATVMSASALLDAQWWTFGARSFTAGVNFAIIAARCSAGGVYSWPPADIGPIVTATALIRLAIAAAALRVRVRGAMQARAARLVSAGLQAHTALAPLLELYGANAFDLGAIWESAAHSLHGAPVDENARHRLTLTESMRSSSRQSERTSKATTDDGTVRSSSEPPEPPPAPRRSSRSLDDGSEAAPMHVLLQEAFGRSSGRGGIAWQRSRSTLGAQHHPLALTDVSSLTRRAVSFARRKAPAAAAQPPALGTEVEATAVDAYAVHSPADEPRECARALARWAEAFEAAQGRPPTVFVHEVGADPALTPGELLSHLPFYLAQSRRLLLLVGPHFLSRLSECLPLHLWLVMGGSMRSVDVQIVARDEDERAAIVTAFDTFHVMHADDGGGGSSAAARAAQPALDGSSALQQSMCARARIRAVELARVSRFNAAVRLYLPRVIGAVETLASLAEAGPPPPPPLGVAEPADADAPPPLSVAAVNVEADGVASSTDGRAPPPRPSPQPKPDADASNGSTHERITPAGDQIRAHHPDFAHRQSSQPGAGG